MQIDSNLPASRAPHLAASAAALFAAFSGIAAAQSLPPAQTDPAALQKLEQERQRQAAQVPQAAVPAAPGVRAEGPAGAPARTDAGLHFILRRIDFGPSGFLARGELDDIAAPYIGKDADFATLTRIVDAVNAAYRAHGVLTGRAVLPPQKISEGIVRIDLVEARLGHLAVSGNGYSRADYLARLVDATPGQMIDTERLSTSIQRFNRANRVQLEADLRPGADFGLTDVMLAAHEPPRYEARVFANNEGAQSIGREQVGVDATLNGPAGLGDRLALYVTRGRGATLGSVSYALPVNRWGGHVSANYNVGHTDVIAGPYRALGISGKTHSYQLAVVQPAWQRGAWYLDLAATVGRTHSENQVTGQPLSDTHLGNQTAGATFAGTDEQRSLSLSGSVTHARATAVAAAERAFNLRQANATWIENAGQGQFVLVRGAVQDTESTVLAPALLFQLGGIGSVRGYEAGVLSGDRGFLVNLEFHRVLTSALTVYPFYDAGQVRTHGLPNQMARSAGLGLDGQWGSGISANVTAGHTLESVVPGQHQWRVTARLSYSL